MPSTSTDLLKKFEEYFNTLETLQNIFYKKKQTLSVEAEDGIEGINVIIHNFINTLTEIDDLATQQGWVDNFYKQSHSKSEKLKRTFTVRVTTYIEEILDSATEHFESNVGPLSISHISAIQNCTKLGQFLSEETHMHYPAILNFKFNQVCVLMSGRIKGNLEKKILSFQSLINRISTKSDKLIPIEKTIDFYQEAQTLSDQWRSFINQLEKEDTDTATWKKIQNDLSAIESKRNTTNLNIYNTLKTHIDDFQQGLIDSQSEIGANARRKQCRILLNYVKMLCNIPMQPLATQTGLRSIMKDIIGQLQYSDLTKNKLKNGTLHKRDLFYQTMIINCGRNNTNHAPQIWHNMLRSWTTTLKNIMDNTEQTLSLPLQKENEQSLTLRNRM